MEFENRAQKVAESNKIQNEQRMVEDNHQLEQENYFLKTQLMKLIEADEKSNEKIRRLQKTLQKVVKSLNKLFLLIEQYNDPDDGLSAAKAERVREKILIIKDMIFCNIVFLNDTQTNLSMDNLNRLERGKSSFLSDEFSWGQSNNSPKRRKW